jgi:hypothetical protein
MLMGLVVETDSCFSVAKNGCVKIIQEGPPKSAEGIVSD